MPYIRKEQRDFLDYNLHLVARDITTCEPISYNRPGVANYAVTKIILDSMKPIEGWGYNSLSRAIAVLRDAANEMQRRLLNKYEDKAIKKNGDIKEFQL